MHRETTGSYNIESDQDSAKLLYIFPNQSFHHVALFFLSIRAFLEEVDEWNRENAGLFWFIVYPRVTLKKSSRLGLKNPLRIGTFCTSISRGVVQGLEKVQWAWGSVGRVWHLISVMNQWNISLLWHTIVQWREWSVRIVLLATLLGPVTIKWPNMYMHTQNTHCCMQVFSSATPIEFDPSKGLKNKFSRSFHY